MRISPPVPAPVEGKAASSRNSLKLGLNAHSMIIPGEDPAVLEQLAVEYEQEFAPAGPLEAQLLETLIQAAWMQKRYARIEAEYIGSRLAAMPEDTPYPLGAVMAQDAANGNTLHKIFRRQQAAQRDWYKALHALTALQHSRLNAGLEAEAAAPSTTSDPKRVRFDNRPQPAPTRPAEPPVNLALRL